MVKRLLKLVAAGMLVATQALSATYWVAPSGGSGTGADSTTNAMTLAQANAAVVAGDVVRFKTGSYTGTINPAKDGTNANRITYRGFPAHKGAVQITGDVVFDSTGAGDSGDDYISVSGLTINGALDYQGGFHHFHFDTLDTVYLRDGGEFAGGYNSIVNSEVGDGSSCGWTFAASTQTESLVLQYFVWNKRNYVYNSTFNLHQTSGSAVLVMREQDSLLIDRSRFALAVTGSSNVHLWTMYGMQYSLLRDSYFTGSNNGPFSSINFPSTRDHYCFNTFLRDTVLEIAGAGGTAADMLSSGATVPDEHNGYNTYSECYFRNSRRIFYQFPGGGETWNDCILISGNADAPNWGQADSLTMDHCTYIVVTGTNFAADYPAVGWTLTNNLFVNGAHSTFYGMLNNFGRTGQTLDYNVYWRIAQPADSGYVISPTGGNAEGVGSNKTWCLSWGEECHSHWADPLLADSTLSWETISPVPGTNSLVYSSNLWPDGYVGAISIGDPPSTLDILSTSPLASQHDQVSFTIELEADGGEAPYTWEIIGGNIGSYVDYNVPTFESAGIIDGVGFGSDITVSLIVRVTDALGDTISDPFTFSLLSAVEPPVITASYLRTMNAVAVIFTGASNYTSYDLRYRTDQALSSSTWDTFGWQGSGSPYYGSFTYKWTEEGTPKSGGADTILVWGLRAGTYQFMLSPDGTADHLSNADTASVPPASDTRLYPLNAIYGGAGIAQTTGFRNWQPWLNWAGSAINTADCDSAARYDMIAMHPSMCDSAGIGRQLSIAAIDRMRAATNAPKILGEPTPEAAYIYRTGGQTDNTDTLNTYNQLFQIWRAARDGGGGWDGVGDNNEGAPGGYTDSTGANGFLWKSKPGWKNHLWDVLTSADDGGIGTTTWNVNLAYKSGGRYVVVDSLVEVINRCFISRQRSVAGTYVWDGVMFDLSHDHIYGATGDNAIDYVRAGYASQAALDSAWIEAHALFMRKLRGKAILAGRPNFIISTNNSQVFTNTNGGMEEHWPALGGGTWASNFQNQLTSLNLVPQSPRVHWLFRFPSATNNTDSLTGGAGTIYNQTDYQAIRWGLGTALLSGTYYVHQPSYASFALGGITGGGFHRWWFDEYAVHPATGQSGLAATYTGWLGAPRTRWYQQLRPVFATRDSATLGGGKSIMGHGALNWGDFNTSADDPYWVTETSATGTATVAFVTDTAFATRSLKISAHTRNQARASIGVHGRGTLDIGSGRNVIVQFRAKSREPQLPIEFGVWSQSAFRNIFTLGGATANPPIAWVDSTWRTYQFAGTTKEAGNDIGALFWMGDTTGTVWIDNVDISVDSVTAGVYIRQFQHGEVIVNPTTAPLSYQWSPTVFDPFAGHTAVARITGITGRSSSVNGGATVNYDDVFVIQPSDAVFLVYKQAGSSGRHRGWLRRLIHVIL